jgi:hypothetical protein
MKEGPQKGWATKDANAGRPPRYPTDKIYSDAYNESLVNLERQQEAIINNTRTKGPQRIAATTRVREIKDLKDRLAAEQTRITKILSNKP